MKKVKWGIISTGRITHQFVQDFEFVPNGEIVAVASRSQGSADAFARQYGIPKAYAGYERLLEDSEVGAVYVATPHTLHFQNTLDAVRAGKHVLCEKPFTVNPAESEKLFETAVRLPVFVMEAMWTYFLPAVRKAQDWVRQGRIGKLRQVKADFGYPILPFDPDRREYNARLAGGCLLDMGIYPVALAWLFMQKAPADLRVVAHKAPNGVEDDVVMVFDYGGEGDGAVATLGTSFRSKLQNWAYIIGEEAYIAIPDFWRASECSLYRLDSRVDHFEDSRGSLGFNYETIACNEDILAGRQQNSIMPWETTLHLQRHMASVREMFT